MRRLLPLALGAPLLAGCDRVPTRVDVSRPVGEVLATITADDLRERVGMLAHDSLRGRGTPSPGFQAAASWIAASFAEIGLDPVEGGDDSAGRGGEPAAAEAAPVDLEPYLQRFVLFEDPELQSANVLGILPGSDPALADRYVLVCAHIDHLGVRWPVDGDSIYNGADDNASGTAAMLELAEAFARLDPAPRRSLLFAGFGAEEMGLRGSYRFTEAPPVPLERIDAVVNLDMVGRNWEDTIAVVASAPSLFATADSAARLHPSVGLAVTEDPWPEEGLLRRSDQWPFIRRGIAGMLVTSGLHEDYHRPSDEADRLDYEKTARVSRWLFHLVLAFADREASAAATP